MATRAGIIVEIGTTTAGPWRMLVVEAATADRVARRGVMSGSYVK